MKTIDSNDKPTSAGFALALIQHDATKLFLCLALAVSVLGNLYLAQKTPPLVKVVLLNAPDTSNSAVKKLVSDSVACVNTLDFADYKDQINGCSEYFTPAGWERFAQEFAASGEGTAIEKQFLALSSITKMPRIVSAGQDKDSLYWNTETNYTVRYQGGGYDNTQSATAVIKVVRVPLTENPRGIAIAQFRGQAR